MSERHKKRRLSEGPFSTLEASQLQKRRLFTDTWTELENREERIAVPARHWMLCYKLFLINEGCFPRGDSCAQLERLDGLLHCSAFIPSHQWGRKPACADHGEKKGLKELFFSFVNHWEHFFFFFKDVKNALIFHCFIWGMNTFISVQWLNSCIL